MNYGDNANKIELHNLTLTNATGYGAAVYSFANELILDNVTIKENNATGYLIKSNGKLTITGSEISESMSGDVIRQEANGDILIENSVFEDNVATDNSAYGVININSGSGKLVIEDSKFINNNTRQGVIKGNNKYNIDIKGTEFTDNTNAAAFGGAIYTSGVKLDITDCVFDNNKAYKSGGAIYVGRPTTATVDKCIFIDNTANTIPNGVYYGDAIYNENKLTITNSAFLGDYNNFMIYNKGEDNVVAQNCWWGTNEDPSSMNGAGSYEDDYGDEYNCPPVDVSNWATMDASFTPADAQAGEEVTVTAVFSNENLPGGIPVTFASTSGNLNIVVSTVGAQASTTYTIGANDEAITATSGDATIEMLIATKLNEADGITDAINEALKGKTVNIAFGRTFGALSSGEGKASTVCLPFELDKPSTSDVGTFYTFSGVSDATGEYVVTMTEVTADNLSAGTPYMFKPATGDEVTFQNTAYNVPSTGFTPAGTETDANGWEFKGTYSRLDYGTAPFSGKAFGFAAKNKGEGEAAVQAGEFVRAATGAYIPAFRAFLTYSGDDPNLQARATRSGGAGLPDRIAVRLIGKDGETQGIGEIILSTGEVTFDGNAWYDLNGRRLDGKPTEKGIYINGGHKVVIK